MKRFFVLALTTLFLSLPGLAGASLITQGDVVYDDINDQYWVKDLKTFYLQTYDEQIAAIAGLSETDLGSYGTWRMATGEDMGNLYGYDAKDIFSAFDASLISEREYPTGTFVGTQENYRGRYDEIVSAGKHGITDLLFQTDTSGEYSFIKKAYGSTYDASYGSNLAAWVVVDGGTSAVPVPAAVWLLGSGLVGLVGLRRKK